MKKILGLDIGVSSVGWAFIHETEFDHEESDFTELGSRIIPLTREDFDQFSKGQSITKHKDRTQKRTARKTNNRYKLRKSHLYKELKNHGIEIPKELFDLTASELYALRERALFEKISQEELARIWFHLNQKRGYQSVRGETLEEQPDESDKEAKEKKKKESEYLAAIASRSNILKTNDITVGQYLRKRIQNYEDNRGTESPVSKIVFARQEYINEFNKIWDFQKQFHADFLTDTLLKRVRDEIIFMQRPLLSQKHLVSDCTFEKFHKATPKSSPLFQIFKVWQDINHFEVKAKKGKIVELTLEMKQKVFNYLDNHTEISKKELFELLDLSPKEHRLNFKEIRGNITKSKFIQAFNDLNINRLDLLSYDSEGNPEEQPLFRLWHLLYSVNEKNYEQILMDKLTAQPYEFTKEQAQGIIKKISFKADFGNLSSRAIRKILPEMQKGFPYDKACLAVGKRHSNYLTKQENLDRTLLPELNPLAKNSLRQPVVEKIVNQVINVVNAILKDPEMGRPDEIRIELARELKQNIKQRKNTEKNNNARKDKRKAIVKEILKTFPDFREKDVTNRMIEKWMLYDETKGICLYTGEKMDLGAVLLGKGYDVEHIIPKARRFDDSFGNKTIADSSTNRDKNDATAYDYMRTKGGNAFEKYIEIIHSIKDLRDDKRDNLLTTLNPDWKDEAKQLSTDFISRQLRETQYITKQVKKELEQICRTVTVTSGQITDYLRHQWGIDDVLKTVNLEKYEGAGRVSYETYLDKKGEPKKRQVIEDWSKRDDHRHHAIDALVIACTRPEYVKRLNDLNQVYDSYMEMKKNTDRKESMTQFPKPKFKGGFLPTVIEATENVLVSFKTGKKAFSKSRNKKTEQISIIPRGQLHEETIYGERFDEQTGERYFVIRKELKFEKQGYFNNIKQIEKIIDETLRTKIIRRIETCGGDIQKALSSPIYQNEEQQIPIKRVSIKAQIKKAVPLGNRPGAFVAEGNNHHLALFKNVKDKYSTELVTLWEAVVRKQNGQPLINRSTADGQKLVMSFQQNEMFIYKLTREQIEEAIKLDDRKLLSKYLYRCQFVSKNDAGQIFVPFRHHLETKLDDSKISKDMKRFILVQGVSEILKFTKVKVNHLGKIIKVFPEGE
jgi:CRISPR-associated endonuclease Csn1